MMIGSALSGLAIKKGRRLILIIASIIGIIGVSITIIECFYLIILGRLIYGLSCGLIAVAMPRYMEEVLPCNLMSMYAGYYCFSFAQAVIIAYFLALGLPPDTDLV